MRGKTLLRFWKAHFLHLNPLKVKSLVCSKGLITLSIVAKTLTAKYLITTLSRTQMILDLISKSLQRAIIMLVN